MTKKTPTPEQASAELGIVDETPEVDEETFDLDAWIDGVEPTIRAVKIYQRPDVLEAFDELEERLRIAKSIPAEERGIGDPSPESIEQEMLAIAEEFEQSGRWFKIRGLSDEARDAITARLKKQGVKDDTTIVLHQLEAAIVSPKGVTLAHLRKLGERSEPQLKKLLVTFTLASQRPPEVTPPLSQGSSAARSTSRR